MTPFVDELVRRSNRNLLLVSLLALGLLIGAEIVSFRYFTNFINGPQPIDAGTLLSLENPETLPQYYVTTEAEAAYDTGVQYLTERGGFETIEQSYAALQYEDRLLLTRISGAFADTSQTTYTGALILISDEIQAELIDVLYETEPELQGVFLPYMLDTTDFRSPGLRGLAAAAVVLTGSLLGIFAALRRINNPVLHPAIRRLSRFGDANQVARQIEDELRAEHPQIGHLHFTDNWLVKQQHASLEAMRYEDVVWAYKKVTQRRTQGGSTGKTFNLHIFDRYSKRLTPTVTELQADEALHGIAQRASWAFIGDDAELKKTWKQQRDQMIAAVDQRIQQHSAAS